MTIEVNGSLRLSASNLSGALERNERIKMKGTPKARGRMNPDSVHACGYLGLREIDVLRVVARIAGKPSSLPHIVQGK